MTRHLVRGIVISALAIAGFGVTAITATSASAATIAVTVNCTTGHDTRPLVMLNANSGDTLVLSGAGCGFGSSSDPAHLFTSFASQSYTAGPYTFVLSPDAPTGLYGDNVSPYIFVDNNVIGSGTTSTYSGQYYSLNVTHIAAPVNPPWLQAVGRASSRATCPEGWSGSWAAWPNGGTGGFVCEFVRPSYGQ